MAPNDVEQFETLRELLDQTPAESGDFIEIFEQIKEIAENGVLEAAGLVAEICAFDPRLYDAASAYKFYNISKHAEGHSVTLRNISEDPGHYLGEVGDFRNEPQVSELVDLLGLDRCKALDVEADDWRSRYSGN